MKKTFLGLSLLFSFASFSQKPFTYDTIRVSQDDARNIHQFRNRQQSTSETQFQARRQSAQTSSLGSSFNAKNLRYGINFGLNLTNNKTLFKLAPQIGYQLNRYLLTGIGVSYYYSKNRVYHEEGLVNRHLNSLGASTFTYLYPVSILVISAQPEINYIWSSYKDNLETYNKRSAFAPSFVVGGGIRLGSAHAMIYYDLVQHTDSPYSSDIFYGISVYF